MRFLDTNVFIRYLTRDDAAKAAASMALFERLNRGDEEVITSEAVIAEVIFVLTSRSHYGLTRLQAVERLHPVVLARGLHLAEKRTILRAIDVYTEHSLLDFEDALTVAHMEADGIEELYSYDRGFDRVEGVVRVEPQVSRRRVVPLPDGALPALVRRQYPSVRNTYVP